MRLILFRVLMSIAKASESMAIALFNMEMREQDPSEPCACCGGEGVVYRLPSRMVGGERVKYPCEVCFGTGKAVRED